jgi:predicted ester cyclase
MNVDLNKTLVARIADDIWNRGDLEVADQVMAPNAKYHGPHMPNGLGSREDWKQAIAMYRVGFPDCHVTFEDLIPSDDFIVGRWSATGTHTGPLPSLPPTGRRIAISGITIYRIAESKIVESWEQLDLLGMWQQLGIISLPGRES